MKLRLPVLFYLLLSSLPGKGQQYAGGQIDYKWLSGDSFQVTLTTYTLVTGSETEPCFESVRLLDFNFGIQLQLLSNLPRINGPLTDPLFPLLDCGGNTPMGEYIASLPSGHIKRNVYRDTIAVPDGDYQLHFCGNHLPDTLTNVAFAQSASLQLYTHFRHSAGLETSNQSAVTQTDTFWSGCTLQPFINPNHFEDGDGDSLTFRLEVPRVMACDSAGDSLVPGTYFYPDVQGGGYIYTGNTGECWWVQPQSTGFYLYTLYSEEFRSGGFISSKLTTRTAFIYNSGCQAISTEEGTTALQVKLHPNPAGDFCRLDWPEAFAPMAFYIYSAEGKCLRRHIPHPGSSFHEFDLSDLPSGFYVIRAEANDNTLHFRLIHH